MTRTVFLGIALGVVFFVASWVLAPGEPAIGATPAADTPAAGSINGFEQMVAIAEAASVPANYGF
jgi:hypothetical protein